LSFLQDCIQVAVNTKAAPMPSDSKNCLLSIKRSDFSLQ
jgi:hypothetical protein